MYCLCVNVYCCHRVTTQLQLTNISYHSIPFGGRNLSFLNCNKGILRDFSPGVKRPEHEAYNDLLFSAEVETGQVNVSHKSFSWFLIKHSDKIFAFQQYRLVLGPSRLFV